MIAVAHNKSEVIVYYKQSSCSDICIHNTVSLGTLFGPNSFWTEVPEPVHQKCQILPSVKIKYRRIRHFCYCQYVNKYFMWQNGVCWQLQLVLCL